MAGVLIRTAPTIAALPPMTSSVPHLHPLPRWQPRLGSTNPMLAMQLKRMIAKWNAGVMVAAGIVLGFALGATTVATYAGLPLAAGAIKDWIPLIGVFAGLAGAWIAWTNVRTTIRVNLMSREEDRMEKRLPGLREAASVLLHLRRSVSKHPNPIKAVRNLALGLGGPNELDQEIDAVFPSADDALRVRLKAALYPVMKWVTMLHNIERQFPNVNRTAVIALREPREETRTMMLAQISELLKELDTTIHLYEARMQVFRAQIEAFFGPR